MNRGIEIASDVADGTRSLILDQVSNGLAVRMAVLYLLAGGSLLGQQEDERAKPEVEPATTNESPPATRAEGASSAPPDDDVALTPTGGAAADPRAQSALEFEAVNVGSPAPRSRRTRPGRPKLTAPTDN